MADVVLVCEDERDIAVMLEYNLVREGFEARIARTGADALARAMEKPAPAVILLDLMLPDLSGVELCRRFRKMPELERVPIIMVTARTDEIDRVVGFEVGADDYVTKPFSVRELMLRIRAVLRRGPITDPQTGVITFGALKVDGNAHRAWVSNEPAELTALEFKLLGVFLSRRGRALSRESLVEETWGPGHRVTPRAVDTHIKRLRQKLGVAGDYIGTVRGVGYRMRNSPDEALD